MKRVLIALLLSTTAAHARDAATRQVAGPDRRRPKQWKVEAASDAAFERLRSRPEFQRLIEP